MRPGALAFVPALFMFGCYSPRLIDCATACGPRDSCASGMTCLNGLCTRGTSCSVPGPADAGTPDTTSATCVRGQLRCVGPSLEGCDQNGVWQANTTCSASMLACYSDQCVACSPGSRTCDGTSGVQFCGAGVWSLPIGCQGTASCGQGACKTDSGPSALSAGQGHTCAVVAGQVKCWGENSSGQLGLGDRDQRGTVKPQLGDTLPYVRLGAGDKVAAVAAGATHTCALLISGQVKCWGDNSFGQLGVGDRRSRGAAADDLGAALPPVGLGAGAEALAISAGRAHTCALLRPASVVCWGDNTFGQLGVGDRAARGTGDGVGSLGVVDLGTGGGALAVSAGANHTCALLSRGEIKCWGANDDGELGQGDTRSRGGAPGEMGDALKPVDLGPGRKALAVAGGGSHTCARLEDGSIKCWGANGAGQLGLGAIDDRGNKPSQLGAGLPAVDLGPYRPAVALAAGASHSCALLGDGQVICWGANVSGQLGLGDTANRGVIAGDLTGLAAIDLGLSGAERLRAGAIAAAGNHACALLMNGEAKCWGLNGSGQLGQGDTQARGDGAGELGDNLPAIRLVGAPPP